ncbi:hypothetical protein J4N45_05590 [Vibrio sp. SCSIO 43140]|uniref:hypothetical protein n=1 Tax=Vibrio sp. SCSIO 43140 TaxID=2819100 RepID=UPI002075B987|nr:hypothetical protein [Vibrio sp. SCSIO 43140]USD61438.1 hypothetical protein J4N45_05590 [Vibrio sp. SCSIO 43140]
MILSVLALAILAGCGGGNGSNSSNEVVAIPPRKAPAVQTPEVTSPSESIPILTMTPAKPEQFVPDTPIIPEPELVVQRTPSPIISYEEPKVDPENCSYANTVYAKYTTSIDRDGAHENWDYEYASHEECFGIMHAMFTSTTALDGSRQLMALVDTENEGVFTTFRLQNFGQSWYRTSNQNEGKLSDTYLSDARVSQNRYVNGIQVGWFDYAAGSTDPVMANKYNVQAKKFKVHNKMFDQFMTSIKYATIEPKHEQDESTVPDRAPDFIQELIDATQRIPQ